MSTMDYFFKGFPYALLAISVAFILTPLIMAIGPMTCLLWAAIALLVFEATILVGVIVDHLEDR